MCLEMESPFRREEGISEQAPQMLQRNLARVYQHSRSVQVRKFVLYGHHTPKRRLTQFLQGVTSQKTAFFIVTAMKTSNLKKNM
jgi:chemotaxis methyl-accepting protein methylase